MADDHPQAAGDESRDRPLVERERSLAARAAELDAREGRLRDGERLADELLAEISHEVRTPLSLILAPVESLLAGQHGDLPEPARVALATVHNNCLRLTNRIAALLDLSRLDAGRLAVARQPTDLLAITRAVTSDFAPALHQKEIAFQLEFDLARPQVSLDRYLYERILFNLLANAAKFTPRTGRIAVAVSTAGDRLRLVVSDTGVGIPQAALPTLFQRRRRGDGMTGSEEATGPGRLAGPGGSGPGLALVKEMAELLSGSVAVESEPGAGTVFTVELLAPPSAPGTDLEPLPERPPRPLAAPPAAAPRPAQPSSPPSPAGRLRVLIAEDNPELGAYLGQILQPLAEIRLAEDGHRALVLAHEWAPDLVVSDVMMQGKDGIALCRELRSAPETAAITVVLLTALDRREDLLRGWEAGADEFLYKPFHPQEVLARIASLLSLVETRKQRLAEQESSTRRLRELNAELGATARELEAFTYSVSHDLRAPLRAMGGFARVLLEDHGPALPPSAQRHLNLIAESSRQMGQLISDLLAFSRLSRTPLETRPVDSAELVQGVLEQLTEGEKAAALELHVEPLPPCRGDRALLRQVWVNLLDNALKYSRGRAPARVEVGSREEDGRIVYFVRDNGVGFDMAYAHKLFGVFQRLHSGDDYEGTGVGLAIVQRIVERHGGQVWAEAVEGAGATFSFSLPSA